MTSDSKEARISRSTFVITTGCLLALALAGVIARFIIRYRVQRQRITADDLFLILAVALLITTSGIIYQEVVPRMYALASVQKQVDEGRVSDADWIQASYELQKFYTACMMLGWAAFNAVKFSFLFLFKKMIDRIRLWNWYWWMVVVYITGLVGYGFAAAYLSCPYFHDPKQLQCAERRAIVIHSSLVIALDIVGDLLLLAIPMAIIWNVRVHWTQKLVVGGSLCLAFIMIILMITRASGLVHDGVADTIWGMFWHFMNAEIAVFLTSGVAFRSFFVARKNSRASGTPPSYVTKCKPKESSTRSWPSRNFNTLGSSGHEGSRVELQGLWHANLDQNDLATARISRQEQDSLDPWPLVSDPVCRRSLETHPTNA